MKKINKNKQESGSERERREGKGCVERVGRGGEE